MGKSSKKASTKVEVAPAAAGTKPIKNGKREAEAVIEKQVHVKKQKQNEEALKQAIAKKKTEAKTPKKAETSSDDDSSESEEEVEVKPAAKQVVKKPVESISEVESSSDEETAVESPAKTGKPDHKGKVASSSSDEPDNDSEDDDEPKSNVPVKIVTAAAVAAEKKDETSNESDSDDDMPSKVASQEKKVSANGIGSVPVTKKEEASESSESEDESDEEDETPAKVASKAAPTNVTAVSSKGKDDTSDSESDDDDEPDSDEKPKVAKAKKDGGSEEDDSEEETSESEEEDKKASKTPKKKGGDVEMVDADDSAKSNIEKAPQTPSTTQVEATGSKTLFMGNLSFSVEKTDVENFFKDAGEIADVRFATDREGVFKGFGHIEFATVEAAENALKLNGHELLGRQIKLDLARERGAYTPATGNENSYQKGGKAQTIFVRGFDTSGGEDQVRSALEEHFGSCGDISRVSIPKDYGGGLKGIAYLDFTDGDALNEALKLDGSELGEATLTVEEAKPRDNSFGSGRGRGRSDGGGRFSGGRGRFGGGRSGGRFGGGGRRGGGRGGRGRK